MITSDILCEDWQPNIAAIVYVRNGQFCAIAWYLNPSISRTVQISVNETIALGFFLTMSLMRLSCSFTVTRLSSSEISIWSLITHLMNPAFFWQEISCHGAKGHKITMLNVKGVVVAMNLKRIVTWLFSSVLHFNIFQLTGLFLQPYNLSLTALINFVFRQSRQKQLATSWSTQWKYLAVADISLKSWWISKQC